MIEFLLLIMVLVVLVPIACAAVFWLLMIFAGIVAWIIGFECRR